MAKYIINVLHLSHTDIGYTETQSRIVANQINYLKEMVLDYKKNPIKFNNWKWICESFYIVEEFLKQASVEEIEIFNELHNKNIVSFSASYLNLSELASETLYGSILKRIKKIGEKNNYKIESALCNDVNGFSIGWAKKLQENKIDNLFFGLHTHHGFYPGFKKQSPFYWETADNEKILVWIGEHYMAGNEIGLVDMPMGNYVLQSDMPEGIFSKEDQLINGRKRIKSYINNLTNDGYEFKNIPISVLGANIDNAPYNLDISTRIKELNTILVEDDIEIKMVSLDEFFENIKNENKKIPVYKGDWPDWWSDGTGSTPVGTRLFREAQRRYEFIKSNNILDNRIEELETNLMLYSEHTWGSWSSIEIPHSFDNQEIGAQKQAYASNALNLSNNIIDKFSNRKVHKLKNENEIEIQFLNKNENDISISVLLNKYLSSKEIEKMKYGFDVYMNENKIDSFTIPKKYMHLTMNDYFCTLPKGATSGLILIKLKNKNKNKMTSMTSTLGADKVNDVYNPLNNDDIVIHNNSFENDFVKISWNQENIYSIYSKKYEKELLNQSFEGFLTPIYEESKITYEFELMNFKRREAGRNRKAKNFKRYIGKIDMVEVEVENKEFTIINFLFKGKGFKKYKLCLKIVNKTNVIDANITLIKDIEWSMQNVFFALPLSIEKNKILIDKGPMINIWKEQLPGTLIDYYSIQEGIKIKYENNEDSLLFASMDTNLIWTGSNNFQKRFLAGDKRNTDIPNLYIWAMNNVWETNFNANIAGFYEFRFKLFIDKSVVNEKENLKTLNENYLLTRKD